MSESDSNDHPPAPEGPALDVDGNLVNGPLPPQPLPPPSFAPADEPLELPELPPRQYEPVAEAYREEPPPPPNRRRTIAIGVFVAALVVGLGLLAVSLVLPASSWLPEAPQRLLEGWAAEPTVVVTSEPDGATVRIDGQVVGTTPWGADNLWGDTTITVERDGYVTFTAPLKARASVRVEARLRRR